MVYFVYLIFYIFFSFIFYPLSSSLISDLTDLAYGIRYVNACESLFTPGLGVYVVIGIHSNLFIASGDASESEVASLFKNHKPPSPTNNGSTFWGRSYITISAFSSKGLGALWMIIIFFPWKYRM